MQTERLHFPFDTAPAMGSTREVAPGVHWLRMPLPMALDHINLYLVDAGEGWYLIDTGLKTPEIRGHWEALFERLLAGRPVLGILVTHMHPDHVGQAGWLSELWQAPLYMTQAEYYTGRTFAAGPGESPSWMVETHYRRAGLSAQHFARIRAGANAFGRIVEPLPGAFVRISDGDRLRWGQRELRVVTGQGHSPDHACLVDDDNRLMFSGDQVIANITSNVSVIGIEPEANPLAQWLASHQRMLALDDELLVLPAHGLPFVGLRARLQQLIDHHHGQLAALLNACRQPRNALDLLPVMFRRKLDEQQVQMALGECIAHLNFLLERGALARSIRGEVFHYCDTGQHQRLSAEQREAVHRAGISSERGGEDCSDDAPLRV